MEDIKTTQRSLGSLVAEINRGKYNFELSIQRREDIWSTSEKSLFIDTLLRDYPVYPALVNKRTDTKKLDVIDYKQRFNTIKDFANNNLRLSKDLKPIIIDDVEYEIAGKKYKQLDEAVQSKFNIREISMIVMTDATPEEIKDIFERINMGHQLTNGQKRSTIQSDEVRNIIYDLAASPFLERILTKAQLKKNVDRDTIIQVLMLVEKDNYDFGSFVNNDMNKFILYYNEKIDNDNLKEDALSKIEILKNAFDLLDNTFPEKIKIKQLSIVFVIYGMYKVLKEDKNTDNYLSWVKNFLENYNTNEEYLQYCGKGTASGPMVNGRLNYFENAINNL